MRRVQGCHLLDFYNLDPSFEPCVPKMSSEVGTNEYYFFDSCRDICELCNRDYHPLSLPKDAPARYVVFCPCFQPHYLLVLEKTRHNSFTYKIPLCSGLAPGGRVLILSTAGPGAVSRASGTRVYLHPGPAFFAVAFPRGLQIILALMSALRRCQCLWSLA